jgi:hypothetical protein
MVVVKHPENPKASRFLHNPCHFADALDAQFLAALIR